MQVSKLVSGRPADGTGRAEKELRVYDLLDKLGIEYGRVDHDEAATMELCLAVEAELGASICKNLFLCNRQKTDFYLLLMPGDKVFKTKELSAQIGSARLSFGSPEDMEALLGVTPGSATVFGLMNDTQGRVSLLIDEDLLGQEVWGCHPCVNTSCLRIAAKDVLEKILPAMGHGTYRKVHLVGEE